MDRIKITGGNKLNGIIPISGAKNAALPLMIASLLTEETLTLENMPHLADVELLTRILGNHGADYSVNGRREHQNGSYERTVHFTTRKIANTTAPYELVAKMRASFWVIGPLLARAGEAIVSLPGGCSIGTRPVDLMLDSLTALGAKIEIENGYARATTATGLTGAEFTFPKVSVGATHVALMAACLARGDTILRNAACEPEIVNLADCLNAMGAKIEGAGTPVIHIQGVTSLGGAKVRVIPDRIETGTYAMAVAMTGGDVILQNTRSDLLQSALDIVRRTGTEITDVENGIRVVRNGHAIEPVDVTTDPFPGFPTDLQAQFMGLMTKAKGTSRITETIFENRFMHVPELSRMGANIQVEGHDAVVTGVDKLQAAPVMATDLRASFSLVLAALVAEGETLVDRIYHIDRGYEHVEDKLQSLGAQIKRVKG